ncbi:ATP-grasp domain-containing protein [Chloroflexota bacterium]
MSLSRLRILVTALGGDLGQALVKALRLSRSSLEIHGCDVEPSSTGSAFVDSYHTVPLASDTANYLDTLDSLCQSQQIQAVLPASEPEITVLSRLGSSFKLRHGTVIVCQPAEWIEKYGDKLYCLQALDGKMELDPFADGSNKEAINLLIAKTGFPVVVKSRRSSGSRTLHIAYTQEQLAYYLSETPLPLLQGYIDAGEGEFSAGVFASGEFSTVIAFRRELGFGGSSSFAETADDEDVLHYVKRIADATELHGSANVQVRKSSAGVRLLEINPRFSSLAAARALCGFRDVEWSVNLALGIKLSPPAATYKHIRFRRFLHEMVDSGNGFYTIAEWCPRQSSISKIEPNK